MSELTYEKLKNNIAEEEVNGSQVSVTFKCPVTEKLHHAVATMRPSTGAAANVKKQAKNELLYAAKRGLRGLLRGVLGGGRAGAVAGNVAAQSVPNAGAATYDKAAQQAAVVQAFEAVIANFAWDEAQKAFVDAESLELALSEFDKQLRDHPITGQWERSVTARMLAEIVAADGKVEDDEREFFADFLVSKETQSLEDLLKKGKLSKLELEECKPDARATMLMLAYAIAMTDENLAAAEQVRLAEFCKALGVSLDREELLRHWAAEKTVENVLSGCYADGEIDDDERKRIDQLAHNIGVNEALVAKLDVSVRKRLGVV